MPDIVYQSVGEGQGNLVSSFDITAPFGIKHLDFLFMGVSAAADRTFGFPSGFVRLPGAAAGSRTDFAYKIATVGESGNYTVTVTGGTSTLRGFVARYSGVNPHNPFDGACVINQPAAGTSNVIPAVSPLGTRRTLLSAAIRVGSSAALTNPGTMSEDFEVTGGTVAKSAAREIQNATGSSGTKTWSWTGTSVVGACLMALRNAEDGLGIMSS